MPVPVNRAKMVGVERFERSRPNGAHCFTDRRDQPYSPDAHMAESSRIELDRVLPLGALAVRWLAICLALGGTG